MIYYWFKQKIRQITQNSPSYMHYKNYVAILYMDFFLLCRIVYLSTIDYLLFIGTCNNSTNLILPCT